MPGHFQALPNKDPDLWRDVTSDLNQALTRSDKSLQDRFERECGSQVARFEALCDIDQTYADIVKTSASAFVDFARAVYRISPGNAQKYINARLQKLKGMNWKIDKNLRKSLLKRALSRFRKP